MSWNREQVTLLIELYKNHRNLYVSTNATYKNKHARNASLDLIKEELKIIRPAVTLNEIKNKFSALRRNFLVERRKYLQSKRSGAGVEMIYKPSIWYYDLMLFVTEHAAPKAAGYDSIPTVLEENHSNKCDVFDEIDIIQSEDVQKEHIYSQTNSPVSIEDLGFGTPSSQHKQGRKRKNQDDSFLHTAGSAISRITTIVEHKNNSNKEDSETETFLKFLHTRLNKIKDDDILLEV